MGIGSCSTLSVVLLCGILLKGLESPDCVAGVLVTKFDITIESRRVIISIIWLKTCLLFLGERQERDWGSCGHRLLFDVLIYMDLVFY